MRKLILILCPFVLFGCMLEVHEDGPCDDEWFTYSDSYDYDDDWGYSVDAGASPSDEVPVTNDEPDDEPVCTADSDCGSGWYCDVAEDLCLPAFACENESDCEPGFKCNADQALCLPADEERCSELDDEATCAERSDCQPTYAGVDCTCGPDCICMGGEPDCVCDHFEFFVCATIDD